MKYFLLIALVLAACGGDDAGDRGLCADRACRTSIADQADWAAVSVGHAPDARCDFVEESKFLAPARADAALDEIVFQDVGAHRLHLDFMTQVLPAYFGGLSVEGYQQLVQRRATRQYWAGALYRLVDAGGVTTGYGFDVVVGRGASEALTEAEVAAIGAQLATRFHLPLTYAPVDDDALAAAREFTTVAPHFPYACQVAECATAGVDCVEVPAALEVCGHFMEGRALGDELATKARVAIGAGTIELPRAVGSYTVPALFDGGQRGPARAAITPVGTTARYQVIASVPGYTQHVYTQDFTVAGVPYELRWEIPLPEGGGGFVVTEATLGQFFTAHLGPTGSSDGGELTQLASCRAATLEAWQVRGTMAGGDGFTIDFRFRQPAAGSGPLFVTRGAVTLGGTTAIVDDYFRLVYAGEHHNWNNQYWVLFDAPLTYAGHPVHGLWLDQADFTSTLDGAHTLDAARQPLDRLDVTRYVVAPVP